MKMKKALKLGWIYVVLIILSIAIISSKKNFHMDEMFSYGLANFVGPSDSPKGFVMQPEEGKVYEPAEDAYLEYLTVQPGQGFNARNVWHNQSCDTHPPVYYLLLNFICSLFPRRFSVWYAGIINIIFAVLTLWCVRKIVSEMTHSDSAVLAASLFFVISAGILANMPFLRMYVMTLFFVTFITYLIIKMVKIKDVIIIALVSILGALTHYFFIVYLFFICLFLEIYLLLKRNYVQAGIFASAMGCAGGVSVIIFPAMLQHMFFGGLYGRGPETIDNFTNLSDYSERLKVFYNIINKELFGGCFTYLAVFGVILIILMCSEYNRGEGIFVKNRFLIPEANIKWVLLILPSICYFLLVSKIAVYNVDRYIFPIYAVVLIWTVCLLYKTGKYLIRKRYQCMAASILLAIVLVSSWRYCTWDYLYKNTESFLKTAEQYKDVNCVYVYDDSYRVQPSYYEVSKYKSVVFWNVNNMDSMKGRDYCRNKELIVCIINTCDQQAVLNKMLSYCPFLNAYKKLGGHERNTSYYLYGDNIETSMYHIYDYSHEHAIGSASSNRNNGENICLADTSSEITEVLYAKEQYANLWIGNRVLDVENGIFEAGNNVQLFDYNGTNAQQWRIQQNEDGTVTFFSINTDLAMSCDASGNICLGLYDSENTSQKWWIK